MNVLIMNVIIIIIIIFLHSGTATNDIIGKGYNIPISDLWTLNNINGLAIFSNFSSEELIKNYDCPHISETINSNYTETNSWYQYFAKSININTDASWHGLDYSVGHSLGQSDYYMWWDQLQSTYVESYNIQNCQQIIQEDDSWSPYDNLSQDFIDTIMSLPINSDDIATMELWKSAFINRFGTHWATKTSHGAQIKSLTSIETSCETSMDCLIQQTCRSLSFVAIYGDTFCHDEDKCDISEGCEETMSLECTVNGGDPSISSSNLCSDSATEEELNAFLSSGDLDSSSSVVSIQFSSLADLVSGAGYYDQFYQVSQAIDYAGCVSPWEWKEVNTSSSPRFSSIPAPSFPSKHSCQCNLECQNGGLLDVETCTCQCPGDAAHGWKGVDCTETYGKCQCAPGSQPNGADQCCVDGNICGSQHENPECGNTEVCCNKDQYATCCPFGYSCDPQSMSVECVANNPALATGYYMRSH